MASELTSMEQIVLLQRSAKAWNAWRSAHPEVKPHLELANLNGLDLRRANLSGASLDGAEFVHADLGGAQLVGSDAKYANVRYANSSAPPLSGPMRSGPETGLWFQEPDAKMLRRLRSGVDGWNRWRLKNPSLVPDLRRADLRGMDLSDADLSNATLNGADLRLANLERANLSGAGLRKANLSKAKLSDTFFSFAVLQSANLQGCDARDSYFEGANLVNANLSRSRLRSALFNDANLSHANLSEAKLSYADFAGSYVRSCNLRAADLTGADLRGANLTEAYLQSAILKGAALDGSVLVSTDLRRANLSGCSVYGISAWDVRLEGAVQSDLLITRAEEAPLRVDDLEMAQFIHLLMSREKLRDVITTIGEKAVLILGRFTERKALLARMADKLRELKYLPMIFDFERPTNSDLTETVKILAGLSRFVIADITNPRSVPLELMATVPDYMVPFVTILERGQPAFGMFDDLPRKFHWALPLLEYKDADSLMKAFKRKVVAPALEKANDVRRQKAAVPIRRSAED
jgi:uncharacterized protein YjbI with pentapeptide repeats